MRKFCDSRVAHDVLTHKHTRLLFGVLYIVVIVIPIEVAGRIALQVVEEYTFAG